MSYTGYTPLDTAESADTEHDTPQTGPEALADALRADPGVYPLSRQGLYVSTEVAFSRLRITLLGVLYPAHGVCVCDRQWFRWDCMYIPAFLRHLPLTKSPRL